MGGAESAILAGGMLVAFGLAGGDRAWIGQEEFCFARNKRVVGLGLLPRIGQAADLAHENHFHRPGRTNRFRRFMGLGTRVVVLGGLVGVLMVLLRFAQFMGPVRVVVRVVLGGLVGIVIGIVVRTMVRVVIRIVSGIVVFIVVRFGMLCMLIIRVVLVLRALIRVVVIRLLALLVVGMLVLGLLLLGMLMLGMLVCGRFRAQQGRAYLEYGLHAIWLLGEQNARERVVGFGRVASRQKGVGQRDCKIQKS
jgi:hypothetical protein